MRIFQPDSAFFAHMCSTLRSALSSWLGATCLACIEGSDFYDSTNVRNESVPGLLGRTNLGPMCEKYPRPRKSYTSVPTNFRSGTQFPNKVTSWNPRIEEVFESSITYGSPAAPPGRNVLLGRDD
ncbi:hypothetical protein NA56DRAFT_745477 [Hyaloscypha hepaticicola]|uniref:Uncharacterized protein n=1 Tax=Hyaloscypha hepaticicola TaxID=2082293 RepID=A0A2J6QF17_9HELO|nr:hypothetical protein NA56DRAFT_745477 [Hyaloscypha hepaticicola]